MIQYIIYQDDGNFIEIEIRNTKIITRNKDDSKEMQFEANFVTGTNQKGHILIEVNKGI